MEAVNNVGNELRFEVDGHLIAALEFGPQDGVPVVALHGWLDNAATYRLLAQHLQGIRLIALDLMGHGFSDHRPAAMPYYIWDNVADVVAVLDELGLSQANLLGHSMGASIATLLAGCYPERVARLCLVEGIAPLVYEPQQLPQLMAAALDKRRRMRNKTLRPYGSIDEVVQARVNGRWPVSEQAARWLVERGVVQKHDGIYWRNDASLVLPSILRMSEDQVRAFIRAVAAPAQVVLGREGIESDLMPERLDCFRQLEVHRVAGNHHLHLQESGARFVAGLLNGWTE
ncbi:alpha/beta fold hydrolase [Marinobacterium arenosum]|uniref:alpha/beta fold hydrolase n=1 Tax=Marinobacterium arenosum TaxID=2862496 RepID=UPI0028F44D47|nr:alpha/beta hydrolase [Marinobacterium arenosum]